MREALATAKRLNLIAVGNAHGQVSIAVPDPERVKQSRLKTSTLSGSDVMADSDPVALPPAIKFVRCANLKRLSGKPKSMR
jgi:hypothetical protein